MTRPPHLVAYQAIHARLTNPASEVWAARAFPYIAPAGTARPYALYWRIGGGFVASRPLQQANITLGVKVVAASLEAAATGCGRLHALLHDQGVHDSVTPLIGGDDWHILTSTAEIPAISLRELVDGVPVFHEGFTLRLFMEVPDGSAE